MCGMCASCLRRSPGEGSASRWKHEVCATKMRSKGILSMVSWVSSKIEQLKGAVKGYFCVPNNLVALFTV